MSAATRRVVSQPTKSTYIGHSVKTIAGKPGEPLRKVKATEEIATARSSSYPAAQHPSTAIARPAVPQTALRADPGRTTAPRPTTPRRRGPPGALAVVRPVVARPAAGRPVAGGLDGFVEAVPCRTRLLNGERSSPSPARPRSRRGNTLSVATSSSATPG